MRIGKAFAWLAVASFAGAVQAQQPAGQPVEFVIAASGSSKAKADILTVIVPINSSAPTAAQARAGSVAKIAKFRSALASAGIGADAVKMVSPRMPFGFVGNADDNLAMGMAATQMAVNASSQFAVEVTSPAQFEALSRVLDDMDLKMAGQPVPSLRDERPQARLAIADAVAGARWRAEAYVAALNMRIAGVKRVEQGCSNLTYGEFGSWLRMVQAMNSDDQWPVDTTATVCITYLATP